MIKKILVKIMLFGAIQLSAKDISCEEFVSMNNNDANRYLEQFKRNIEIISDDTRDGRKRYLDRNYEKTEHIYNVYFT